MFYTLIHRNGNKKTYPTVQHKDISPHVSSSILAVPLVCFSAFLRSCAHVYMRERMLTIVRKAPCACAHVWGHARRSVFVSPHMITCKNAFVEVYHRTQSITYAQVHPWKWTHARRALCMSPRVCICPCTMRNCHARTFTSAAKASRIQVQDEAKGAVSMPIDHSALMLIHVHISKSAYKHHHLATVPCGCTYRNRDTEISIL